MEFRLAPTIRNGLLYPDVGVDAIENGKSVMRYIFPVDAEPDPTVLFSAGERAAVKAAVADLASIQGVMARTPKAPEGPGWVTTEVANAMAAKYQKQRVFLAALMGIPVEELLLLP